MKKQHFLLTLVMAATTILATGCQKEKGTVTLGAEIQKPINSGSKVYLEDHTPSWVNGDQIIINDDVYSVFAATGSLAQIENVTASSSYRALYPSNIVPEGTDISNSSSIPVTLPEVQTRQYQAGRLKMDIPMGAYMTSGSTLQFHNLCSIVRITISNSLNVGLSIGSIVLHAENACLSGAGTAIITGLDSDSIAMSSNASHDVTLDFTGDNPNVEALSTGGEWDIIVPPFRTDNVTITVNTTDGQYFEIAKPNVKLVNNTITTVTLNVNDLNIDPNMPAVLSRDLQIPHYATAVVFEYNSNVSSGTLLSTGVVPIYGNMVGNAWTVSTSASTIIAPTDCSWLLCYNERLRTIDFGSGFNTANVTDMAAMFYYCTNLTSLNLSCFNTSNVTNMGSMFEGCHNLASLDVSNFNTSNVTSMDNMFASCESLTTLDLSNFNTSNVASMGGMFSICVRLTSLDVSNFITSNVTNMGGMFVNCVSLTSLDVSNFNTTNVRDMSEMFHACENLSNLNLSSFNTSNVILMDDMFSWCVSLTSLNLSNFDMSLVDEKVNMCERLSTTSGACTITCPWSVENAIKEQNPDYDATNPDSPYYISGLPTSGVTFNWVQP